MTSTRLKTNETDPNQFNLNAEDYPPVRALRAEQAAINVRLATTIARRNDCWNRLCTPNVAPAEDEGILARTRRLLAGDATAARSGAGSPAPEEVALEHRQLLREEQLLNAAQSKLSTQLDRELRMATHHRKARPDFELAREALANAALALLEVHRAGFELAERVAAQGFDLSEAVDGWSGAHLPMELVENLERVVAGERVIPLDMQRFTVQLINRALTTRRAPDKPSLR
jgi:hypothetical protein